MNLYEMSTYKSCRGDRYLNSQNAQTWTDIVATVIRFKNSQTLSNVHFHSANKLTICTDNGLQTPITAILSTHLLHGFILNVKCTEWFDLIETLYLLVVFLETIFCQSNMFIFCECYVPNNFSYLKTMKVEEKNKWMIVKFHLPLTSLKELIC